MQKELKPITIIHPRLKNNFEMTMSYLDMKNTTLNHFSKHGVARTFYNYKNMFTLKSKAYSLTEKLSPKRELNNALECKKTATKD